MYTRTPNEKIQPEFFRDLKGNIDIQWRCTYCNRVYISKETAEECCNGKPRNIQITTNDGKIYYLNELEYK